MILLTPPFIYFYKTSKTAPEKKVEGMVAGASTKATPSPILTLSPSLSVPAVSTAPIQAISRKVGIGVVVDDYSNKSGELSSLNSELKGKIGLVSIYKQFGLAYNNTFNPQDLSYEKSSGMTVLLAWEPWDPRQGMSQSTDFLKDIISGGQDEYMKSFASQIKAYQGPVIIRFGHEMNGTWYPWGQRPAEYVQAYQRVYELFRNEGVTNVKWMWSINASPMVNFNSYYPGSSYVDYVGIDGFNFGNTEGHTWVSFQQIFQGAYNFSASLGKPLYISEVASTDQGGDKANWIRNMFASLSQMPAISEIIWFNLNKERDWRLQANPSTLQSFQDNL